MSRVRGHQILSHPLPFQGPDKWTQRHLNMWSVQATLPQQYEPWYPARIREMVSSQTHQGTQLLLTSSSRELIPMEATFSAPTAYG